MPGLAVMKPRISVTDLSQEPRGSLAEPPCCDLSCLETWLGLPGRSACCSALTHLWPWHEVQCDSFCCVCGPDNIQSRKLEPHTESQPRNARALGPQSQVKAPHRLSFLHRTGSLEGTPLRRRPLLQLLILAAAEMG